MEVNIKKIILLLICIVTLTGCINEKENRLNYDNFYNTNYVRSNEGDTETISFSSNGEFHYSCSCGNPVNDSDLCETYKINERKNTITLKCNLYTKNTIKKIKVLNVTDNELKLDFNGEIRTFKKT